MTNTTTDRNAIRIMIDGDPAITCTLAEFHEDNAEGGMDEEFDAIAALAVGETYRGGGGAGGEWTATRIA